MPYVVPTVDDFLEKFPELFDTAFYDQAKVQDALDEASEAVGTTWLEKDYQNGILYLAAHLFSSDPAITGAGASGGGEIQSESLGLISVTYAQGQGATIPEPTDYASTVYGQRYLRLLRLNHPAIVTI